MRIALIGLPYKAGDVVMVTYGRSIDVGRFLSYEEAKSLNARNNPWPNSGLTRVRPRQGKIHYFPDCKRPGSRGLARSIQATTCRRCLRKRADFLKGWRWNHEHNREETTWLKEQLGKLVDDFGIMNNDNGQLGKN